MELIKKNLKVSRRDFGKYVGLTALLPILSGKNNTIPYIKNLTASEVKTQTTIDTIAGRTLSEEEKQFVSKFFEGYNKSMVDIRRKDLHVDLAPAFIPKYPNKKSKSRRD
jgi:hypothetical protein